MKQGMDVRWGEGGIGTRKGVAFLLNKKGLLPFSYHPHSNIIISWEKNMADMDTFSTIFNSPFFFLHSFDMRGPRVGAIDQSISWLSGVVCVWRAFIYFMALTFCLSWPHLFISFPIHQLPGNGWGNLVVGEKGGKHWRVNPRMLFNVCMYICMYVGWL